MNRYIGYGKNLHSPTNGCSLKFRWKFCRFELAGALQAVNLFIKKPVYSSLIARFGCTSIDFEGFQDYFLRFEPHR